MDAFKIKQVVTFTAWAGDADPDYKGDTNTLLTVRRQLPDDGSGIPAYLLSYEHQGNTLTTSMFHDEVTPVVEAEPEAEPIGVATKSNVVEITSKVKAKSDVVEAEPIEVTPVVEAEPIEVTPVVEAEPIEVVQGGNFIPQTNIIAYIKQIIQSEGDLAAAERVNRVNMSNDFVLGGVIAHIHKEKSYVQLGYEADDKDKGFEKYVEEKLGIKYRKAMFLKNNFQFFETYGDDVINKVIEMGWAKAKEIVQASRKPNFDDKDIPLLVDFAVDNTREALTTKISKDYVDVPNEGGESTEKRSKTKFTFALHADEGDVVAGLLNQMVESKQVTDLNQALLMIVTSYIDMQGVDVDMQTEVAVKALEARTGKKVTLS